MEMAGIPGFDKNLRFRLCALVNDYDIKQILEILDGLSGGADDRFDTIGYIRHLCLAMADKMYLTALNMLDGFPHEAVKAAHSNLKSSSITAAKACLGVTEQLKWNPVTETLEYGYEPSSVYACIVSVLDPPMRKRFDTLAYLMSRLPNEEPRVYETYATAKEAVDAFKCPGPCSPECALYGPVKTPDGEEITKCHPSYYTAHEQEILLLIGRKNT